MNSLAVHTGALVRQLPRSKSPAIYRVRSLTRNGWATCLLHSFTDGARADEAKPVKFRISQLGAVK